MDSKKIIWIGMFVGSTVGSSIPSLWGVGYFSLTGVFLGAVGGFLGIYIGFKLGGG